jgi:hypothetical protein
VKDLKEHPDIQEIYDVLQEYTIENQGDDDEDVDSPVSPPCDVCLHNSILIIFKFSRWSSCSRQIAPINMTV